jgi:hypothetical protein
LYKTIIGLFFIVICQPMYSWTALGHMLVAKVAYSSLEPSVRKKVDNLTKFLQREYPVETTFVKQSTWPDDLRKQKIEAFTHWHYIDYAFSMDSTPIKNLIDTDNALWAMNLIKPLLNDNHVNVYDRARFLAFVSHIVGDLHQPLHTVARISATNPDGDLGGNLFFLDTNKSSNLHSLWDNGVGYLYGKKAKDINKMAQELITAYPQSSFDGLAEDLDETHWAEEGMHYAKTIVYITPEYQYPNEAYREKGQIIAKKRIVLAGYRLGHLLNTLFGS